ncbi:hypothetical protein ACVOMS_33425 [Bradyrhizobium guangxiense]
MKETLGCSARSFGGAEQQLRTGMGKTLISVAVMSLALVIAFAGHVITLRGCALE